MILILRIKYFLVILTIFLGLTIISYSLKAQLNSVYMLPTKWMVGHQSGMNFVSGTNTIIDPVNLGGNPATNNAQEATTTICMPDKNIALYCNNYQVYSTANGLITTVNNPSGGYSSTEGAITLPDPATAGDYYLFSGNDLTGGSATGINWYRIRKAGATYTILSGPNNIATTTQVNEGLAVSSDGNGGYWVISHTEAIPNEYWSWHVTSGGVGAKVVSASQVRGGSGAGGSISINKCQTKIAIVGALEVEVYNWDKTTGTATPSVPSLFSGSGAITGYSGDFSPNGNVYYYAGIADQLKQWDLTKSWATGVVDVTGASSINGVQLGPNNKIYLGQGASSVISALNTPNNVGAGAVGYVSNAITLTGNAAAIRVNLANLSWADPQKIIPRIDTVGTIGNCTDKTFSINFPNYYGDEIDKQTATILWDWGHGGQTTTSNVNPSHTFPSTGGPYTVTLSFKDIDGCQTWTNTKVIPIVCPAPVELVAFNASAKNDGVQLTWQTAMELNNDYFEIQSSFDGVNFQTIGSVKGAGNSNRLLSYSFMDYEVENVTKVYYQLIQHDFDGKTDASKIVVVNFDKSSFAQIVIAPNPFSDSFVLTKLKDEKATIVVYDIVGRIVEQKSSSEAEVVLQLGSSLSNGTYIIEYITTESSYTTRVEKQ